MAISARFNFAVGVTVNIITTSGTFVGELIDEVDGYLVIRLTTAAAPFTVGQVIRININRIVTIG